MDVSREVRRFSQLLRLRIVASGMTQRAVERKLGWSSGYVSQLLRGNQDLKLKQVYAILHAIGVPREDVLSDFARARAVGSCNHSWSDAARARSAVVPETAPQPDLRELLTQLRPMVRELVRETLGAPDPELSPRRSRLGDREMPPLGEVPVTEEPGGEAAPPSLRPPGESLLTDDRPGHPKRERR